MLRLAMPLAFAVLLAAGACGGGSDDDQPAIIQTAPPVVRTATATPAPTNAPTTTPAPSAAPTGTPTPTPSPTPPPPPNNPPAFAPSALLSSVHTEYTRDSDNKITGAVTTFGSPTATDPDGDVLSYGFSVSTGSIVASPQGGVWTRAISDGAELPGTITITASDGKGGTDSFVVDFQ